MTEFIKCLDDMLYLEQIPSASLVGYNLIDLSAILLAFSTLPQCIACLALVRHSKAPSLLASISSMKYKNKRA